MALVQSRSLPAYPRKWASPSVQWTLCRNCSRHRTKAHLMPQTCRSLLRYSSSTQCSIRCGMIRAFRNSPLRNRRNQRTNNAMWRSAILGAELNPEVRDIRVHRLSANQNRTGFCVTLCVTRQNALQFQQFREFLGISHRGFAREILAYVRGWFSFNQRHRTDRLVSFAEILLAFIRIGQNHNCVWEKMATNFFE